MKLGTNMIEMDVYICKSGEPVVIHNSTLKRTTNGHGRISHKTLKELKTLDAGKGQTIPTLQEVLDCIRRRVQVNIELKGPNTALPVAHVIGDRIRHCHWCYGDFLISSSSQKELRTFHTHIPHIRIGLITSDTHTFPPAVAEELHAFSIHPHFKHMPHGFVRNAHDDNRKVFPYTVNELEDIRQLLRMGVDGIITDYPDRISQVMDG